MTTVQADVESALRALDDAFVRHANGKDAAGLVSAFYADEATLLPPNAPIITDRGQIEEFWKGLLDAGAENVTLDTTQIESSGDLAYGVGRYSFTMPSEGGGRTRLTGKYLVTFKRQGDGSWKAVADMFSGDQPEG